VSGDGCDANCTPTGCGNGVLTAGEACDDGNQIAGDGCDASCAAEGRCGDGLQQAGEACDDGNDVDGDGCDTNCTATGCGNGVVTAGEACDDGAGNGSDGCCTALCQLVDADGDGTCDRDDVCAAVADPTQGDRDRDGKGDACDRCPDDLVDDPDGDGFCLGAAFAAPALGGSDPCSRTGGTTLTSASASFTSLDQGAGSQHMHLKGRIAVGAPVPRIAPDRFGIHVRVTDRNGALVVDEHLPGVPISDATKQGWRAVGNPATKWLWVDNNTPVGHNGIDNVTVQAVNGVPDTYDLDISAQTGTYGLTPGREPVTVGIELNDSAVPPGRTPGRDQCGEIAFGVPPASPSCRFEKNDTTLTCD
jgi:cysteine-rich repeat protein